MASVIEGRAPGAYIEQAFKRTETPFLTGVPAFIGLVGASSAAGKAAESDLFSDGTVAQIDARSFAELEARCGKAWGGGRLGLSVRGFFENGGSQCYVVDPRIGDLTKAIEALDIIDDFDLVCAPDLAKLTPGATVAAQVELAEFCKQRGGCFALLDSIGEATPSMHVTAATLKEHRDSLVAALTLADANANAALYGPWIRVREGCPTCNGTGYSAPGSVCQSCRGTGGSFVPPCGHVAGVIARTDKTVGVHKAPANEPIDGAVDIQLRIDEPTQAAMNPKDSVWINCIRAFPGRGIRAWGARTLSSSPEYSQVSVRRLLLTIGRWLERFARVIAFEPNNFALWIRINRQVSSYLQDLFAAGALKGATAKDAFFVKCDGELNTPAVRDAGQVIAEVGVAPVKPNEFIIVRLIGGTEQSSTDLTT